MKKGIVAKRLVVLSLGTYMFWLFLCSFALGQSGTSSISGTVTDPQGKVVVGATVTLKNSERNFTRSQMTNDRGGYVFTSVSPGLYLVEAEAGGFKKLTIGEVRALVDIPTNLDLQLAIGEMNEAVTITAEGAETRLNTQDATIGNNFDTNQISQFPLES
ncbi:MAG: hypothetical protein DMG06_27280, partial [Acidobacteria bacterium]